MKVQRATIELEFIENAMLHHDLSVSGDRKGSDLASRKVSAAWKKLSRKPEKSASFLRSQCSHQNASVRLWAATFLLPIDAKVALETLNDMNSTNVPWQIQALAEVVLEQWKSAN